MEKLKMSHGPWNMIFSGTWANHEMHFYENPNRITLVAILEKDKKKITGIVLILNKIYIATGNVSKLIEKVEQHTQIIEKHYPSFRAKYLVLSSEPSYTKPEAIDDEIDRAFATLEAGTERINSISKEHGVDLTELKNADPEFADKLFSEPVLLPTIVSRETGAVRRMKMDEVQKPARMSNISFGIPASGASAEDNIEGYFSTLVIGNKDQRKKGIQLVVENCSMNKVPSVIFDENNSFTEIGTPNKEFDFDKWPDLQPVGMPVKNSSITQIGININFIDPAAMKEILGIRGDHGGMAFEIITKAMEENKDRMKSLKDLAEKVGNIKESGKKFQKNRAMRLLKVFDMAFPDLFKDKVHTKMLVSPMLGGMGAVTRLDVSKLPVNVRIAFIYSSLKSLYDQYKDSIDLSVMFFIPNGIEAASRKAKADVQEKTIDILGRCNEKGIGFCLGTQHEIDIEKTLTERNTAQIDFITENEVAIKREGKKPYRVKLRPTLSG